MSCGVELPTQYSPAPRPGEAQLVDDPAPSAGALLVETSGTELPREEPSRARLRAVQGLTHAREKLRAGMYIFIREGTTEQNMAELLPVVTPQSAPRCLLVSDDRAGVIYRISYKRY